MQKTNLKVLRKVQFLPLLVLKKCSLFDIINIDKEMVMKMFKRKATEKLMEWKEKYSSKYAVLLQGARRVGKSTIAENFAKDNYKSYISIDFSNVTKEVYKFLMTYQI